MHFHQFIFDLICLSTTSINPFNLLGKCLQGLIHYLKIFFCESKLKTRWRFFNFFFKKKFFFVDKIFLTSQKMKLEKKILKKKFFKKKYHAWHLIFYDHHVMILVKIEVRERSDITISLLTYNFTWLVRRANFTHFEEVVLQILRI